MTINYIIPQCDCHFPNLKYLLEYGIKEKAYITGNISIIDMLETCDGDPSVNNIYYVRVKDGVIETYIPLL